MHYERFNTDKIFEEKIELQINLKKLEKENRELCKIIKENAFVIFGKNQTYPQNEYLEISNLDTDKIKSIKISNSKNIHAVLSFVFDEVMLQNLDMSLTLDQRELLSKYIINQQSGKSLNSNKSSDIYKLFIWEDFEVDVFLEKEINVRYFYMF